MNWYILTYSILINPILNNFSWYFVWVNFLYTEPCCWWKWWLLWLFSKLSFRRWVTQHLLAKLGPFIQFMAKIELSTDTGIAKISLLKAYICFLSTKKTNKRHLFLFLGKSNIGLMISVWVWMVIFFSFCLTFFA